MSWTKRTTASRRPGAWTPGCLGALVVFSSLVGAILAVGSGWGGWLGPALAPAILMVGGSMAGIVASRNPTRRGFMAALAMPFATLAPAWMVPTALVFATEGTGLDSDFNGAFIMAFLFLEIPIAVAFSLRVSRLRSILEEQAGVDVRDTDRTNGGPQLGKELDRATGGGRIATVVRNYIDDEEGREHMEADTRVLLLHGYHVQSVVREGGPTMGGLVLTLIGHSELTGNEPPPTIVATFGR